MSVGIIYLDYESGVKSNRRGLNILLSNINEKGEILTT